jgi:hypothetical protein
MSQKAPSTPWDTARIQKELEAMAAELGRFPTYADFQAQDRMNLYFAAYRSGGLAAWAERLDLELTRRPRAIYWTPERIESRLAALADKSGGFPTYGNFVEHDEMGLYWIVLRQGGVAHWASLLAMPLQRHSPAGEPYWTDERVEGELQAYMSQLGHFPSYTELRDLNRLELYSAVLRYRGGMKAWKAKLDPASA